MVSALSQRLLSGYSSNSSSGSSSKKRKGNSNDVKSDNGSGYSADREERNGTPPIGSIDLHEGRKVHSYDPNGCEKRRKTHELQFAASTVKQDLARAGFPYPQLDKDKETMSSPGNGGYTISLKGVRLVNSKELETPSVVSNTSYKSSASDYEQLMAQCYQLYKPCHKQNSNKEEPAPSSQDSDRSTSSVSDTESDSCESNSNGGSSVFVIPPLLEDSPKTETHEVTTTGCSITSCNVISSSASAVTMSEMLSVCKQPRLVATSTAPYRVVFCNAAFSRHTGLTACQVVGKPFNTVLGRAEGTTADIDLPNYAVSSGSGINKMITMRQVSTDGEKTMDCRVKVLPIVSRRTESSELQQVTHFAIEVASGDDSGNTVGRQQQQQQVGISNSHLAVGVMG